MAQNKSSGLSNAQRRANIQNALSKVYVSTGGVTGSLSQGATVRGAQGATGGTQFVVNSGTGEVSSVRTTPENLRVIEAGRKREIERRQSLAMPEIKEKRQQVQVALMKVGGITGQGRQILNAIKTPIKEISKFKRERDTIAQSIFERQRKLRMENANKEAKTNKYIKELSALREYEASAANRFERAERIYEATPFVGKYLKGENFVQKTVKYLLAAANPIVILAATGEQAAIAGLKLAMVGKARRLAKEGIFDIRDIRAEERRALKETPKALASGFDPRTPQGLGNLILIAVASKAIRKNGIEGLKKITPNTVRKAANSIYENFGFSPAQKAGVSGNVLKASKAVQSSLRRNINKPSFIRRIQQRANVFYQKVKTPFQTRGKNLAIGREVVRKIEANKKAIASYKQLKHNTMQAAGKKFTSAPFVRRSTRFIDNKIKSLESSNKIFTKKLRSKGISILKQSRLKNSLGKIGISNEAKRFSRFQKKFNRTLDRKIGRINKGISLKVRYNPQSKIGRRLTKGINIIKNLNRKINIKEEQFLKAHDKVYGKSVKEISRKIYTPYKKLTRSLNNQIIKKVGSSERIRISAIRKTRSLLKKIDNIIARRERKILNSYGRGFTKVVRKIDTASTRASHSLINKINRVISPTKRYIKIVRSIAKKLTFPALRTLRRLGKQITTRLKRTGGRIDKNTNRLIKKFNRVSPLQIKIVIRRGKGRVPLAYPRRGKLRGTMAERMARAERIAIRERFKQLPKTQIIKLEQSRRGSNLRKAADIIRGKKRITANTPPQVRKLVRKIIRKGGLKKRYGQMSPGEKQAVRDGRNIARKAYSRKVLEAKGEISRLIRSQRNLENIESRGNKSRYSRFTIDNEKAIRISQSAKRQVKVAENTATRELGHTEQNQVLILEKPKVETLIRKSNKIKKSANKTEAISRAKSIQKSIKSDGQRLITILKKKPAFAKYIIPQVTALTILSALVNKNLRQVIGRNQFQSLGSAISSESKQGQKGKHGQKGKQGQKGGTIQVPIVIPDQATKVNTKQKANQITNIILTTILGTVGFLTPGGNFVPISQSRLRGGLRKVRNYIYTALQKKRYVYTADMYSILFGIRARPRQRLILLKKGRIFSGLERRALVR